MNELDEMFAEMRFNVEGDLLEIARLFDGLPTCQSQSHRALRALDWLEAEIKRRVTERDIAGAKRLFTYRRNIRDFLAVHRTVEMLDARAALRQSPIGQVFIGTLNH